MLKDAYEHFIVSNFVVVEMAHYCFSLSYLQGFILIISFKPCLLLLKHDE